MRSAECLKRARVDSINYQRKAESKRQAKDALRALNEAREYLAEVTSFRGEIPPTRAEFDAAVFEMRELRIEYLEMRALMMSYIEDRPCPQQLFAPWASTATILKWRKNPVNPLPFAVLNKRVCIRPHDFFSALEEQGKSKQ